MDLPLIIIRFLYNIRYRVLILSTLSMLLVAYFTQFMPLKYSAFASIFTAIGSQQGLSENQMTDYYRLVTTYDNVINLTKSKGTLEKVSIRLLATNLFYGDPLVDNMNISAKHYKQLADITPPEVMALVDKSSFEKTLQNLQDYKENKPGNFVYELFSYSHPHYSYKALDKIEVKRIFTSDLIEIHFSSNDPGIATNTVSFLHDQLIELYNDIRYQSTNEVITYYVDEIEKLKQELHESEEELTKFNIDNRVMNYQEQTKSLAGSLADFNRMYENSLYAFTSSSSTLQILNEQLNRKSELYNNNKEFIAALDEISEINGKLTEIGLKGDPDSVVSQKKAVYQQRLKLAEEKISKITDNINNSRYSKEGVATDEMVNQWLEQTLLKTKSSAELRAMELRKEYYDSLQTYFSPIGTHLHRQERNISVLEESYINALHSLHSAELRLNNIKVTSSSFSTVSPATFPLKGDSKRKIYILFSFVGTALLIIGIYIFIEIIDRTLQNPMRAEKLTKLKIAGAFLSIKQSRYRGYVKACNRKAASALCNSLTGSLKKDKTTYINLISINRHEGKDHIATYMKEYWEKQNLTTQIVQFEADFECTPEYFKAETIVDFVGGKEDDFVIIIQPPLTEHTIPQTFLNQADANLFIADGKRVWRTSDDKYIKELQDVTDKEFRMVLNNAKRHYVEDVIGMLPPLSSRDVNSGKFRQLGFTTSESQL